MTMTTSEMNPVQTKTIEAGEFKVLDDQRGVVEAIVSVTGVVDHVNDVIMPGAYKDTLAGRQPKVCWGHDWKNPVGKVLAIEEMLPGDARLPPLLIAQSAGAVKARVQFNLNTQRGREAYEDVKFWGPEGEWSIGYDTQSKAGGVIKHNKQTGVREIHKLALYELSPVIFGAAPGTGTTSIKWLTEAKRDFPTAKREAAAGTGAALPDGSFPIYTRSDLRNAMSLVGQAKDVAKARAHIIKRANSLGFTDMLSDSYKGGHAVRLESKLGAVVISKPPPMKKPAQTSTTPRKMAGQSATTTSGTDDGTQTTKPGQTVTVSKPPPVKKPPAYKSDVVDYLEVKRGPQAGSAGAHERTLHAWLTRHRGAGGGGGNERARTVQGNRELQQAMHQAFENERAANAQEHQVEQHSRERHEALDAFKGQTAKLDTYMAARKAGKSHAEAMSAARTT
jgi:HK97 family phage prohead protease